MRPRVRCIIKRILNFHLMKGSIMALEKVGRLLEMADEKHTAVIGFNCMDYNMAYSVVKAAEEAGKPAIIMLYPEHCDLNCTNPIAFAGMVKGIAEKSSVPIGLHLDHSSDFEYIIDAIRGGFRSVMYDGSMLSLEENIENSKKVIEVARIFDAEVETELGRVGVAANKDEDNLDTYTKPEVAKYFAEETGATSIAVAIGSAHGFYKETPRLDIERLDQINAATDVPLVLHGGSGIPDDQIGKAFEHGINKFNVGAEFLKLYYDSVREYCGKFDQNGNICDISRYAQNKLIEYLKKKLELSKL
jgi:fructose-bisphosphate aldolase class II